jgi:type VI secretion system protein ImpF
MQEKVELRASLIDRLIDEEPSVRREIRPLRTLSPKQQKVSLARDLLWLLNTRTPIPASVYLRKELTVIDYGIPDFGKSSPANPDDRDFLAQSIAKAISVYEPRLRDVRISVKPETRDGKSLDLVINAIMAIDEVREPISFQTIYQKDSGAWDIYTSEF